MQIKKKIKKKSIKKSHFPLNEVFAIKTIIAVGSILLEPKQINTFGDIRSRKCDCCNVHANKEQPHKC